MTTEFDDIRPYTDEEIPSAMSRIASSQMLPLLASYVCPEQSLDAVRQMLLSFKSIHDFQLGIMYHVNEQIIANSITAFTYGGTEHIEKDRPYLLVSNHRDIMLDASLLQNLLVDLGLETSQITFGANLMMNPLVVDIGKSNKMFRVERPGGSIKDFYKKYAIRPTEEGSVWLAGLYRTEDRMPAFVILTRPAADSLAWMHDRMPVMFTEEHAKQWICPEANPDAVIRECLTRTRWEHAG